jgi:pimeloyl-ACP methyl ester carboxylesterase
MASSACPTLLLHSIPVTSTIWRDVVGPLESYGPVPAPDLLGFGSAQHPDIAYSPEDYTA